MFILRISEGDLLMKVIGLLTDITEFLSPLIFDFSPDRLWIAALLHPDEIAHAALMFSPFLFRDGGSSFHCNNAGIFGLCPLALQNSLHFEEDDDYSVTIRDDSDEGPSFQIFFGAGDPLINLQQLRSNVPRCVVLVKQPVLRVEAAMMRNLLHHRFRVLVGLHPKDFRGIFCRGSASITITHEQAEFSAGEDSWVFPKGVRRRQCIIGGVGEAEEDGVEFRIRINRPRTVIPAACLSDRVWILHSNGTPTMIGFLLMEIGGFLKFFFVREPS